MMKKSALLGLALSLMTAASAYAEKDNVLGLNPITAIFGYYSGEYGRFIQEGAAEINVPFTYYSYDLGSQEIGGYGIGLNYRMYKDKNKEGLFYGAGLDYSYLSDKATFLGETVWDLNYHFIIPHATAGYRWIWGSGFTMAPSFDLGYRISTFEKPKGELAELVSVESGVESGISWGIGLGFGWNF